MLNVSATNLFEERLAAVNLRRKHSALSDQLVEQYKGTHYRDGESPELTPHENHAHAFVINTITSLVYSNPKFNVKSDKPRAHRELAKTYRLVLNHWAEVTDFVEVATQVAYDTMFSYGCMLTTLEPLPGYEDATAPPLRPKLTRISPKAVFVDPQANGPMIYRFMGHDWIRDLEDLKNAKDQNGKPLYINLDGLTPDVSGGYGGGGSGAGGGDGMDAFTMPAGIPRVDRNQVRGFEVFVPEHRKIYSLAIQMGDDQSRKAVFIREPRDYFGPPWGPYTMFGIYLVPDQIYPLAPLAVTQGLVDEINAHEEVISEQADEMRQITIIGSTSDKVQGILDARSGVHFLPGFHKDMIHTLNHGGPHPGALDYVDRLRDRLDRRSSLDDADRGNIPKGVTATAVQKTTGATSRRKKFMHREFRRGVIRVFKTVLWYHDESKMVVYPIPVEADVALRGSAAGPEPAGNDRDGRANFGALRETLEGKFPSEDTMEDGIFLGGNVGDEEPAWPHLRLTIEPYSIEEVDEETLRAQTMQLLEITLKVAPMILQFPWMNWPKILDDVYQTFNVNDARAYVNWEMIEQMLELRFESGMIEAIPGLDGIPFPDVASIKRPAVGRGGGGGRTASAVGRAGNGAGNGAGRAQLPPAESGGALASILGAAQNVA